MEQERPPVPGRWWMLAALCLSVLVLSLDFTVLNVALPTISTSLHASISDLQWIVDAYSLAVAGAMLPAGAFGDKFGRKRVLLIGLAIFFGASFWAGLAHTTGELTGARALLGIGSAIILPMTPAMLVATFDGRERTKAMAVFTAAIGAGMPLGPIVGGALLQHFSWNSVFWINVPVVAITLVVGALLIKESRDPAALKLDWLGTVLAVTGIVALVYGVIRGPEHGWANGATIGVLAAAVVLLAVFVLWERRFDHPLMNTKLFRNRVFTWNTVAIMIVAFALAGVVFVVPQYIQVVLGYDSLGTGLRIIPLMGGLLVAGAAGSWADKMIGIKAVVVTGLVVMTGGLVALSQVKTGSSYGLIAGGLASCGFGIGAVMGPALDAAISASGGTDAGASSAVVNTLRQVGSALAVAGLGSILSAVFSRKVGPALHGLPAAVAHPARESVAAASAIADKLGPSGAGLRQAADLAYIDGMSAVMLSCAGAAVLGTIACLIYLPRRIQAPDPVVLETVDAADFGAATVRE
ncbi:MFS transporter [Kitasatospora sp. NPDC001175]|uniref:MFS transporter n=1 Tax=Kitasatospora sp. NPDC001175 TaxID=3157103 RepID=UPI003D07D640